MVAMAQDFNSRYPLIDGQGNMGSIDGDPPAAMRYTEMRMSPFAMEMLEDLEKDTVDWQDNYDQTRDGADGAAGASSRTCWRTAVEGIAVGMATNIPPHNLTELCDGITHLIDNPEATVDDLMQFVKGPGFPDRRDDPRHQRASSRPTRPAAARSSCRRRYTSSRWRMASPPSW